MGLGVDERVQDTMSLREHVPDMKLLSEEVNPCRVIPKHTHHSIVSQRLRLDVTATKIYKMIKAQLLIHRTINPV